MSASPAFARLRADVLAVLHDVPRGRVTTYGTIAEYLGVSARQVARVMSSLSEGESEGVAWYRVVGAGGAIRTPGQRQSDRLLRAGVVVNEKNVVEGFAGLLFTPGG
jgi:methylated-DNA-protein-cysteine methyltransferase-like protein